MHSLHVFESFGDENSIKEDLSVLEADHFIVGREENSAPILYKVEEVVAWGDHLGTNRDIVVQKERLLADILLLDIESESLNIECTERLHAHRHPIVEAGHALDCNLIIVRVPETVLLIVQ